MAENNSNKSNSNADDLPPDAGTRYKLAAEEELRLEVPFHQNKASGTCTLTLQQGSCELWGVELAVNKPYVLTDNGGLKIALFTWHGCVVDVDCEAIDIAYTTDETTCNVAFVNTHAQLEALRDQAAAALVATQVQQQLNNTSNSNTPQPNCDGPRVLICGPAECGKSTLAKILTAYACKLGRTPLLVDLDPQDASLISVPGTLGACPMSLNSINIDSYATGTGIPPGTASPLLFWHGQDPQTSSMDGNGDGGKSGGGGGSSKSSTGGGGGSSSNKTPISPELFRAQVNQLAERIDQRLLGDDLARASGLIVNTNGWIEGEGFELLLHSIEALRIHIVLVLGHDRLYSMLKSKLVKKQPADAPKTSVPPLKVIKLPRSGGVVSRGDDFVRRLRNRSIKQYFYGALMERPNVSGGTEMATTPATRVPQLTPFLLQIPMDQVTIYKFSSIRLSASLLPVAAAQASEAIQLVPVLEKGRKGSGDHGGDEDDALIHSEERAIQVLQHHVLAVCHRHSVTLFEQSQKPSDLYLAGVAGFCTVERIVMDKLHLLSPCAGSLPSHVLLMGNIMWME